MSKRIPGLESIYASPVAAGGHVYLTSRNGTIAVINDSEKLDVIATNSVDEMPNAMHHPRPD